MDMRKKITGAFLGACLTAVCMAGCQTDTEISQSDAVSQNAQYEAAAEEEELEPERIPEEYGYIDVRDHQYINELDETVYTYEMECFEFYTEMVPKKVVETLEKFYEEWETVYQESGEGYMDEEWKARLAIENGESEEETMWSGSGDHPYNKWEFLEITYADEDYVSLRFNDISYMGGARSYSMQTGITIACETGEIVSAAELLGVENDVELLCEISEKMGTDELLSWDDVDFYITDQTVVFFYKMPGYWDDVVISR